MLVQSLFDGPVDVIGDIHGEIDALRELLLALDYRNGGVHPEGRRLVFLGDLTDRGPNSPAVVRLVAELLDQGLAQCVLGNHELNLLRLEKKHGNRWFHGQREALDESGRIVPQALADERIRQETLALFRRLPLVLEREDLRVVHACWQPAMIERVRKETDVLAVMEHERGRIREEMARFASDRNVLRLLSVFGMGVDEAAYLFTGQRLTGQPAVERLAHDMADEVGHNLAEQNWNPVKILTSGPEKRVPRFYASGKWRQEGRVAWWEDYRDPTWVVVGHYGRTRLEGEECGDLPFDASRPYAPLGPGGTLCIDYSVARRWHERFRSGPPYRTALAALRWPEKWLYFDTGRPIPIESR